MTPDSYIAALPADRIAPMTALRETMLANLPEGFDEIIASGMINYVVPLSAYPAGYHCTPGTPLPFLAIASQKHFVAVYHMGMYAHKPLLDWFLAEWPKHSKAKPDMGKSCIRFKKPEALPLELLGQLAGKMKPEEWIDVYERVVKR